jgi:hypothetical protein
MLGMRLLAGRPCSSDRQSTFQLDSAVVEKASVSSHVE